MKYLIINKKKSTGIVEYFKSEQNWNFPYHPEYKILVEYELFVAGKFYHIFSLTDIILLIIVGLTGVVLVIELKRRVR